MRYVPYWAERTLNVKETLAVIVVVEVQVEDVTHDQIITSSQTMASITIAKKKSTIDQDVSKGSTQLPAISPNPEQKQGTKRRHRRILTQQLNQYVNSQYLDELVMRQISQKPKLSPKKREIKSRSPEQIIQQAKLSIEKRKLGIKINEQQRQKTPNSVIQVFKVSNKARSQSLKKLPRLSPSKYADSYKLTNKKHMHNYKIQKLNVCTVELQAMCREMQKNIERKLRAIEQMDSIVD